MTVLLRDMRPEEAGRIAAMVRGLARDVGAAIVPQLTGETLNAGRDLVDVLVAEEDGILLGAILTLMTFSTWRGAKGLYVVDLFVEGAARNRNIGLALLREAARRGRARGARFIKLEVDHTNLGAVRFYKRLGFAKKENDRLFVLEQNRLETFIADKERS
ncbi:MAG: GNAT family N-acetyltransferase [Hyphomicrobiales bacterium]